MIFNAASKVQTAVSHSTPEAEIVAADYAMRQEGVTYSNSMFEICYSGKNPTMRSLNRTREVGISWLMEVFKLPDIKLHEIDIKLRGADIGTERITCIDAWLSNCVLINLANKDTDAKQLRSSLITLRLDASDKLAARKIQQQIKQVE
jgi:hypothetical protein